MQWHGENPRQYMMSFDSADWMRLQELMGAHYYMFVGFTIQIDEETDDLVVMPEELGNEGSFEDWASSCKIFPNIVNDVERFLSDDPGTKDLWEFTGIDKEDK